MSKMLKIILVLLLLALGFWWYLQQFVSLERQPADLGQPLDPQNSTYLIDGVEVTLQDGISEGAQGVIITYFGNDVQGDFDGDGSQDLAFLITAETGGSGTFFYLAALVGGQTGATNTIFLGDRIAPQTTEWRDGFIIVNYADRAEGEPMTSEPSVGMSRYFSVVDASLQEVTEDQIELVDGQPVKLYYYKAENDVDANGNVICSREGLRAVERTLLPTETPIEDTIRLLLAADLDEEERAFAAVGTAFPLEGVELLAATLDNGVLILEFADPLYMTSGGSCRAQVLWYQIEATALQFSEVTEVRYTPEDLFQP